MRMTQVLGTLWVYGYLCDLRLLSMPVLKTLSLTIWQKSTHDLLSSTGLKKMEKEVEIIFNDIFPEEDLDTFRR